MAKSYLKGLNNRQRRAVMHGIGNSPATNAGPILVIAGAGSGKTKTLAHRVVHLLENGVDPNRILLLTFSRRAAEDMILRVRKLSKTALGSPDSDLQWAQAV
jgi:DNA helicase-2/ATP-dependent DNA helicase PcrA